MSGRICKQCGEELDEADDMFCGWHVFEGASEEWIDELFRCARSQVAAAKNQCATVAPSKGES